MVNYGELWINNMIGIFMYIVIYYIFIIVIAQFYTWQITKMFKELINL